MKGEDSKKPKKLRGQTYEVVSGDTVRQIAEDLHVEPWQVLDQQRKILQWPGALEDIRPLAVGEQLFITSERFVTVMESGAANFGESSEPREEDVDRYTFPNPHRAVEGILVGDVYADYSNELAPFGSDEGWDAAVTFMRDPRSLRAGLDFMSVLRDYSGSAFAHDSFDPPMDGTGDIDRALIGLGFAFLWTRGEMDLRGVSVVESAIRRQMSRFGDESLLVRLLNDLQLVVRR